MKRLYFNTLYYFSKKWGKYGETGLEKARSVASSLIILSGMVLILSSLCVVYKLCFDDSLSFWSLKLTSTILIIIAVYPLIILDEYFYKKHKLDFMVIARKKFNFKDWLIRFILFYSLLLLMLIFSFSIVYK